MVTSNQLVDELLLNIKAFKAGNKSTGVKNKIEELTTQLYKNGNLSIDNRQDILIRINDSQNDYRFI